MQQKNYLPLDCKKSENEKGDKMKKKMITALITAFMILPGIATVKAAETTVALDVNSAYVWRGITFNDGLVFQPSIDVAKGGFGINVWANMDGDDYSNTLESGEFSEVDITLSYKFNLNPVDITLGYIEYLFPTTEKGGFEGTRELFVSLGIAMIPNLSGGLDIFYDVDEVEDFYLNASLAYNIPINDKTGLNLGAAMGYAGDEYCADGDSGLYDYLLSCGLGYTVSDDLSISASLYYTQAFDEDKLPDQDTDVFGGIGITYAF